MSDTKLTFGSYKRGLDIAEKHDWFEQASHVLLCNDSVLGPFMTSDSFLKKWFRPQQQFGVCLILRFICHICRAIFC